MRIGSGLAVMALAAAPVAARDVPAAPRPMLPSLPLQSLPLGTVSTATLPAGHNLRLRVDTASAVAAPGMKLQSRFKGSMIDFYPLRGTGFRLSAGTKLFADPNVAADGNRSARGLLSTTRALRGIPRLGKRRTTPALTMGYTGEVGEATSIGVEMGALRGRSYRTVDELAQHRGGGDALHPMLNLVVGRRF